jgi:hypothetical protein
MPSFCVIKHYYYGKYHRMAVNYCGKFFITLGQIQCDKTSLSMIKYRSILTLELVGLKLPGQFTVVMFYNIGPWSKK